MNDNQKIAIEIPRDSAIYILPTLLHIVRTEQTREADEADDGDMYFSALGFHMFLLAAEIAKVVGPTDGVLTA